MLQKAMIGKHLVDDRFIIWQEGDRYFFGHSERGNMRIIKGSDAEKELVAYALDKLEKISNDAKGYSHWRWRYYRTKSSG